MPLEMKMSRNYKQVTIENWRKYKTIRLEFYFHISWGCKPNDEKVKQNFYELTGSFKPINNLINKMNRQTPTVVETKKLMQEKNMPSRMFLKTNYSPLSPPSLPQHKIDENRVRNKFQRESELQGKKMKMTLLKIIS